VLFSFAATWQVAIWRSGYVLVLISKVNQR